jgi:hypothetical protein
MALKAAIAFEVFLHGAYELVMIARIAAIYEQQDRPDLIPTVPYF